MTLIPSMPVHLYGHHMLIS